METQSSRQTKLLKTAVSINFIRVGLFVIHLLSHMLTFIRYIKVNFKFSLVDCVSYNGDFVIERFIKSSLHCTSEPDCSLMSARI